MQKIISKLSQLFENSLYWGLFTLFLFLPLYLKFPLFGIEGTFVSIRLEDFLIAFVFLIWFLYLLSSGKLKDFLSDKLNQTIILFFLIGLISIFSATFLTKTVSLELALFHYLRRVELIMLLPITISAIKEKRQAYVFLTLFVLVVFLVNFYALGQRYLGFPAVSTTTSELSKGLVYYLGEGDRINSTFAGHYDLAVFLLMAVTIFVPLLFHFSIGPGRKSLSKRYWMFITLFFPVLIGISTLVLIMTATRLSFVAAVLGVFVSLILLGKRKLIIFVALLVAVMLLYPSQLRDRFMSTFTVNILNNWESFKAVSERQRERSRLNIPTLPKAQRAEELIDREDLGEIPDIVPGEPEDTTQLGVFRSFDIRINVEWPRAINAFLRNPLLGSGYSSITLATDNDLLRSLGEVGMLGTLAFILIIIETAKRVWRGIKSSDVFLTFFSIGVISMVLAFLLNSLFIDVFEASKVAAMFWMLLGVNLALVKLEGKS